MIPTEILQGMADKWPSDIVARENIHEFSGGLLTKNTMRWKDKTIPRFRLHRKIFYKASDLVSFLSNEGEVVNDDLSVDELLNQKQRGRK